jgi:hypothetical protein
MKPDTPYPVLKQLSLLIAEQLSSLDSREKNESLRAGKPVDVTNCYTLGRQLCVCLVPGNA